MRSPEEIRPRLAGSRARRRRRVVYQSFEGRYCDNPRFLFEALGATSSRTDHVWLVDPDHADGFPADVRTAEWGTPEGRAALESAALVIANTHTDTAWDKPTGCTYLQTWHGTPLKRIHWDVLWAPEGRLERLSDDVARWDHLLSQNAASTPLLRQAFRYDGPVHETGYPRTDALAGPTSDLARAEARRRLGLAEDTVAVLYAPTWRDDQYFAAPDGEQRPGLDLEAFAARLGDTHRLLARVHPLLTGTQRAAAHPAVQDVSGHPDIADLHLAADVLVTDYSSTMVDFAVTGRPILLHVHDLDDYTGRTRGLYVDLRDVAPGPLLTTSDDVLDALADLPAVASAHAERHARFRATYCRLDDGRATARALAAVPALAALA